MSFAGAATARGEAELMRLGGEEEKSLVGWDQAKASSICTIATPNEGELARLRSREEVESSMGCGAQRGRG